MKKITLAKPLLLLFLGSLFLLSCSPAPQSTPVAEPVVITESATSAAASQPDLSGIWQAVNTAHWNVEGHTAKKMPVTGVIGAYGGMLAGTSVVVGGEIPYRADALAAREVNQADWANLDPAAKCYMPGIPRQTYMPAPFQILQTDSEIFIAYEWVATAVVSLWIDLAPVRH